MSAAQNLDVILRRLENEMSEDEQKSTERALRKIDTRIWLHYSKAAGAHVAAQTESIVRQAVSIVEAHGRDAVKLIISSNAEPGFAFSPFAGYVLILDKGARFIAEHFDTRKMMHGRTLSLLSNNTSARGKVVLAKLRDIGVNTNNILESLRSEISASVFNRIHRRAEAWALKFHNNQAEERGGMKLKATHACPSRLCLVGPTTSEEAWLMYEGHAEPADQTLAAMLNDLSASRGRVVTVMDVAGSQILANYKAALENYRGRVILYTRYALMKHLIGKSVASELEFRNDRFQSRIGGNLRARSNPELPQFHFTTNTFEAGDDTNIAFYSKTQKATLRHGGFIYAGPYSPSLWVNIDNAEDNELASAGLYGMLPFCFGHTHRKKEVLEQLVFMRMYGTDANLSDDNGVLRRGLISDVENPEDGMYVIEYKSAHNQHNKSSSVMGRVSQANHVTVCWSRPEHVKNPFVDKVMVNEDQYPALYMPYNNDRMGRVIADHGIDLENNTSNVPVRVGMCSHGAMSTMDRAGLVKLYLLSEQIQKR